MAWFNNSWSYRREVTVDNTAGAAQTDFPVKVTLSAANFTFANAKADGSDVRFTSSDETTLISHWIESWDSGGETAVLWVKVPTVGAATTATIYMYFGNAGAAGTSAGADVFTFFEDFADANFAGTPATPNVLLKNYANTTRFPNNPIVQSGGGGYRNNQVREQSQVFTVGGTWYLFITGYDGAESDVGLLTAASVTGAWTDQGSKIPNAEDPYVAINTDRTPYNDGTYYYIFFERKSGTTHQGIGVARTSDLAAFEVWDGAAWTATVANHAAVLNVVAATWEATGVGSPLVVHDGSEFTMLYEGWSSTNYQTGVARSMSVTSWTRYGSNPIATFDSVDDVVKIGSTWYLTVHGDASPAQIFSTADEPGAWDELSFALFRNTFGGENGSSIMLVQDNPNLACYYNAALTRMDLHDFFGSSTWTPSGQSTTSLAAYTTTRAYASSGELTISGADSANSHLALVTSGVGLLDDFMVMARRKVTDKGTNLNKFWQIGIGSGSVVNTSSQWPFFQNHYGGQGDSPTTFNIREYGSGAYVREVGTGTWVDTVVEAFNLQEFWYLADGTLTYRMNSVQIATGTDTSHIANSKDLMISQGNTLSGNPGGISVYDWLAVRTFDGVDPSQTVGAQEDRPASSGGNRMGGTGAIRKPPRNVRR